MLTTSPWQPPAPRSPAAGPTARGPGAPGLQRLRRQLRRAVRRARRPVAALLLAAATGLVVHALLTAPRGAVDPGVAVVVAARDLPAGGDLAGSTRTVRLPSAAVPAGALGPGTGQVEGRLAAPVRRGEVLTDVRLVGSGLLSSLGPGEVALPVAVASALPDGLVGAGDRVTVLAGGGSPLGEGLATPSGRVLVAGATVLAVEGAGTTGGLLAGASGGGGVVVLALPEPDAARVAAAATSGGVVLAASR